MAVHAHILGKAIESFWKDETQTLLTLQKTYFDMFYDWELRMNQWTTFLNSLKYKLENP